MRTVMTAAVILLGPAAARADGRAGWETTATATAQYNHESASRAPFGAGVTAGLFGPRGTAGVRFEATWMIPDADTVELDAWQVDVVAVGRIVVAGRPGRLLRLEGGAGLAFYTGRVDLPEDPDCWGCGAYGDTTVAAVLQAGIDGELALRRGLFGYVGVRGAVPLHFAMKTDIHNFAAPIAVKLDVGLGTRF